jgi:hypothetical protein
MTYSKVVCETPVPEFEKTNNIITNDDIDNESDGYNSDSDEGAAYIDDSLSNQELDARCEAWGSCLNIFSRYVPFAPMPINLDAINPPCIVQVDECESQPKTSVDVFPRFSIGFLKKMENAKNLLFNIKNNEESTQKNAIQINLKKSTERPKRSKQPQKIVKQRSVGGGVKNLTPEIVNAINEAKLRKEQSVAIAQQKIVERLALQASLQQTEKPVVEINETQPEETEEEEEIRLFIQKSKSSVITYDVKPKIKVVVTPPMIVEIEVKEVKPVVQQWTLVEKIVEKVKDVASFARTMMCSSVFKDGKFFTRPKTCLHKGKCRYAHTVEELQPMTCRYGAACRNVKNCSYFHPHVEEKKTWVQRVLCKSK